MRHALAAVVLVAGCGGGEPAPDAAAADPSALACESADTVDVEGFAGTGRPVADARALLEDELEQFDRVERVDSGTVRVVRGGQVVALVHFDGTQVNALEVCRSLVR